MAIIRRRVRLPLALLLATGLIGWSNPLAAPPHMTFQQGRSEKESRTEAQKKINSQLLYELYRRRGEAEARGVPPGATLVKIDKEGRAHIDIRCTVSDTLLDRVKALGGLIESSSVEHHTILARFPILKLEELAMRSDVRFIEPAAEATTVKHD